MRPEFFFVFKPDHQLSIAGTQARTRCFLSRGDHRGDFRILAVDQHAVHEIFSALPCFSEEWILRRAPEDQGLA
jgi:hypothetical protein